MPITEELKKKIKRQLKQNRGDFLTGCVYITKHIYLFKGTHYLKFLFSYEPEYPNINYKLDLILSLELGKKIYYAE